MAAHSETSRLIATTLDDLRRLPEANSAVCAAAWGITEVALTCDQLAALALGLPGSIALNLSALPPITTFRPRRARILLNLLLIVAGSLPCGGTIDLLGDPEDLFLRIEGQGASWPQGMGACLVDEAAARDALTAGTHRLMPLTALLAHEGGVRLSFLLAPRAAAQPSMLRMGG